MKQHMRRLATSAALMLGLAVFVSTQIACEDPASRIEYESRDYDDEEGEQEQEQQPVEITDITLGDAIGGDHEVIRPTQVFEPSDTVFVSITMEGTESEVHLTTRWYREREEIHVARDRVNLTGDYTTEMHLRMPDRLPEGRYTVEVSIDDQVVTARQFQVVAD